MTDPEEDNSTASGVQNLIDRIRGEGVKAGEEKAHRIVRDAEQKAANIVADAKSKAEESLADARARIAAEQSSAEESLKLAARDTIQELGENVRDAFTRQLKRFVSTQLEDREFLREVILALAGQTADETLKDKAVEILLSENLAGADAGADSSDEDAEARIRQFILSVSSESMREGIEFKLDPHAEQGVSVRVVDEELRIDLNEVTISDFLVRHLLPRYRRILAGEYPDA
jgi:V/A-type H+-transporting ATPase subunit E